MRISRSSQYADIIMKSINEFIDGFVFVFSFNFSVSLSWPSELTFPSQIPLIISSALLSVQTLEWIFKWVYRKFHIEELGKGKMHDRSISTLAKRGFEAALLFPAWVIASAQRRWNERRKRKFKP